MHSAFNYSIMELERSKKHLILARRCCITNSLSLAHVRGQTLPIHLQAPAASTESLTRDPCRSDTLPDRGCTGTCSQYRRKHMQFPPSLLDPAYDCYTVTLSRLAASAFPSLHLPFHPVPLYFTGNPLAPPSSNSLLPSFPSTSA